MNYLFNKFNIKIKIVVPPTTSHCKKNMELCPCLMTLYELVFRRKSKILLNLETTPDIKVTGAFKECYELLNKRLKYLHDILQSFKSKRIAMINKD